MQQDVVISGLPPRLALDGYWLASVPEEPGRGPTQDRPARPVIPSGTWIALALLGVVLAADLLLWNASPILALAVFAVVIYAAAAVVHPVPWTQHRAGVAILVASALPLIEYSQLLSVVILVAGLMVALVKVHGFAGASTLRSAAWLFWAMFYAAPRDALGQLVKPRPAEQPTLYARVTQCMRDWAIPLGGCLIFGALIFDANPLFERYLMWVPDVEVPVWRIAFWAGIAFVCWPLIHPAQAVVAARTTGDPRVMPSFGVNATSSMRALVLFNVLIGVQTTLDLGIFVGGAALPEGMSYATYAHRGAYPLLLTALLAGVFALLARPYLQERRGLVALMMLWLAQNVALCGSAFLRLDLYVSAYGLTYLRIWAMIWMVLVAIGLMLIAWQVWAHRSDRWLTLRFVLLGGVTLYAYCFVNVAAIIAHQNLTRGGEIDWYYICHLPKTAQGTIDTVLAAQPDVADPSAYYFERCLDGGPVIHDWRNWGFRKARVIRTIEALEQGEVAHENSDRR